MDQPENTFIRPQEDTLALHITRQIVHQLRDAVGGDNSKSIPSMIYEVIVQYDEYRVKQVEMLEGQVRELSSVAIRSTLTAFKVGPLG